MSGVAAAEHANHAAIGNAGASHQVHEHFRGTGIEADDRDAFARRDPQRLQAKRAQRLVSLLDVVDLEDGWLGVLITRAGSAETGAVVGARLEIREGRGRQRDRTQPGGVV